MAAVCIRRETGSTQTVQVRRQQWPDANKSVLKLAASIRAATLRAATQGHSKSGCGPLPVAAILLHQTEVTMAEKEKQAQAQQPQQNPINVDESKAVSCYANFCRVTGSPEELIVDFGMNAQPMGTNDKPVEIQQRIVLNFFTAKRLLHALHVSVQRHEQVFGEIETDIQKRVKQKEPAKS
jgi:hypothetical protein